MAGQNIVKGSFKILFDEIAWQTVPVYCVTGSKLLLCVKKAHLCGGVQGHFKSVYLLNICQDLLALALGWIQSKQTWIKIHKTHILICLDIELKE